MRILLVSEGRHELALDEPECPLCEIVRRILDRNLEFHRLKVSDPVVRVHAKSGKSLNYERRALAWLKFASDNGFDALVLVIDRDRDDGRTKGISAAQGSSSFSLPRAMGVAVESFDAWMLADEKALSQAFGQVVNRQPDPENTSDAKRAFRGLMDDHGTIDSQTELYLAIAKCIELEILAKRCPQGFRPFHDLLQW